MNNKVLLVCSVVLVVAVVAGAFLFLSDNDSENPDDDYVTNVGANRLMIFGNANGDDYLDEKDLETLEKIVKDIAAGGSWDKEKNYFADANQDGKIDQKDIDFTKRLVAREPMEIFYLNVDNQVYGIDYPVGNFGLGGIATFDSATILDVRDKVAAVYGRLPVDQERHKHFEDTAQMGKGKFGNGKELDLGMIIDVAKNTPGGLDAIITRSNWITPEFEAKLSQIDDGRPYGVSVIKMGFGSSEEVPSFLTTGYLVQAEEASHKYVKFLDEIDAITSDVLSKVKDSERPTVLHIAANMKSVPLNTFDECKWSIKAGAINNITKEVLGDVATAKRIQEGDVWQYDSAFDADYITYTKLIKYDATYEDYVQSIRDMKPYWELHECYPERLCLLTAQVPSTVGVLYYCQFFYPDKFTEDIASQKMQIYVDEFLQLEDYDVSEHTFFVTYDDVKDDL